MFAARETCSTKHDKAFRSAYRDLAAGIAGDRSSGGTRPATGGADHWLPLFRTAGALFAISSRDPRCCAGHRSEKPPIRALPRSPAIMQPRVAAERE